VLTKLTIPDGLDFADLALEREPVTGRLLFAPAPLAAMCRCNKLDPAEILADEVPSRWLICEWYVAHVTAGGAPDRVAEQILAEVADSPESGTGLEH
jgi:hypothetical protein